MSPTLQFLPDLAPAPAPVPRPRFLHLRHARITAISREIGTEMAAATTTEEFTSAGTMYSRPLESPGEEWAGMEEGGERELVCGAPGEEKVIIFILC